MAQVMASIGQDLLEQQAAPSNTAAIAMIWALGGTDTAQAVAAFKASQSNRRHLAELLLLQAAANAIAGYDIAQLEVMLGR